MQRYILPDRAQIQDIIQRPALAAAALDGLLQEVFAAVRDEGDAALRRYTARFDKVELAHFELGAEEWAAAEGQLDESLKAAIRQARHNIAAFHAAQRHGPERVETMPGVDCWREARPIERVGLYVPGGTAPLFSTVLMLAVPAQLAGCQEIVLCSPPDPGGRIHPAILYAAQVAGVRRVFKLGGIQAIAALALGTAQVPQVYKIFGPGNQYVTAAKQHAARLGTAIDMPAGPSEVLVLADGSADPAFIAADLLAQAEHGSDSQAIGVFYEAPGLLDAVADAVAAQLADLPRRELAAAALRHSKLVEVADKMAALELVNAYAPEHLIVQCRDEAFFAERVQNAGSVFLGPYSPESVGDYASGTNHTLPTNGFAKAYSGVSLDSFVKKITYQRLSAAGLQRLGPTVEAMASAERLEAHRRAVSIRLARMPAAPPLPPFDPDALLRPHLAGLRPYSSARDEFFGAADIFVDANENPFESPYNRYPDAQQRALKAAVAELKGLRPEQVFLGHGSDEVIDLLFRAYAEPGRDNALILPPTYGMYEVSAGIHGVALRRVPLDADWQPDVAAILAAADSRSKLLFLCSPNNPTGNLMDPRRVEALLRGFGGLVVLDEAYAEFAAGPGWAGRLAEFPNLVLLHTFSKAWGLAGIRLGMGLADPRIVAALGRIKPPYNISGPTQAVALAHLARRADMAAQRDTLLAERARVAEALVAFPFVRAVFPSEANFLLLRVDDADGLYEALKAAGIVVRNRSRVPSCEGCLRLSIGTPAENTRILAEFRRYAGA